MFGLFPNKNGNSKEKKHSKGIIPLEAKYYLKISFCKNIYEENMKYIIITILAMLMLISCGDKKQYNEEEMEVYSKKGQEIVLETFGVLRTHLMSSIQTGGIGYAVGYCNEEAQKLMDSMSQVKGVKIRRTTLNVRNPNDVPDAFEREALLVIKESLTLGQSLHPILKKLDEKTIAYFHPILIDNPVCLNCHGVVGVNVDSTLFKTIKELYPNDNATGYKMGDLRGMWSVRFTLGEK